MRSPEVTVLIATFNRARYLARALDSVLAQSLAPSQVIVIDDGSTDATPEVLEPYRGRIEVLTQANGGKSSALNLAMPRVRGRYVWIFDDDDVALPDGLERHVRLLEACPEVDFTYGTGYVIDLGAEGVYRRRRLKELPELEQDGDRDETFVRLLEYDFMPQQAVVARRRCYREVGPFDESLPRSQDYDMMLRLTRRFVCRRVEEPTFLYVQHFDLRGQADDRFGRGERELRWLANDRIVVGKLYRGLELREYLPGHRRGGEQGDGDLGDGDPGDGDPGDGELSAGETRRALLQRMCSTARRGLWAWAWDDLRAACGILGSTPLSAAERRICVSAVDKYLGRYFALDALLEDREAGRQVLGLGRRGVAGEIRNLWAGMLHRYGVEGPLYGYFRHVPRTLLYAWRLDGGRQLVSTVVASLRRKYAAGARGRLQRAPK